MYTISAKNKNGVVWDGENDRPMIRFKNGKAETKNLDIANRLNALGYDVQGLPDPEQSEEEPVVKPEKEASKGKPKTTSRK